MKLFRLFLILVASIFLFSGCEKDYSFEGGVAKGTVVKDALGVCLDLVPVGVYATNNVLTTANYINVPVAITEVGTYTISTDTINGFSFSDTGTAVLGINTFRLKAHGKPLANGIFTFKVKFDGTSCSFDVSVSTGVASTIAVFTFAGAPNTCTGATPNPAATFMQNIVTTTANWVDVNVNVTNAGSYNVNTGALAINGVKYSGIGTLALGNQTIRLIADGGTPTLANTTNYPITGSGSNCGFDVVYQSQVGAATFTINCGAATVQGVYVVGTVMDNSNTITLPITLTTPGSYTISVVSNGVTFTSAGLLNTGATSIILVANGTGIASGAIIYNITGGTGATCPVTVNFTTTTPNVEFIKAKINGSSTFTNFNVDADANFTNTSPGSLLAIAGKAATLPERISFQIQTNNIITINTNYAVNLSNGFVECDYYNNLGALYRAENFFGFNPDPFTIRLTFNDGVKVEGTFFGSVRDFSAGGAGIPLIISEGSFSVLF